MSGRYEIPVQCLEFEDGGNTFWVHSPAGATVLRVKCSGKIRARPACINPVAHVDLMVDGDIEICIPGDGS